MKQSKLTRFSLVALFAAGQAFAHTGVRDTATEGASSYNAFTITHGCGNSTEGGPPAQAYPVIGQAALFPNGDYAVWRDGSGAVVQVGGNGMVNGTATIDKPTLALAVTGYAGGSGPFVTTEEIVDSLGTVQGLLWKDGVMAPNLNALTQFKISAPTIANNCVKSLKIRIGVINYCDVGKNASNDRKGPYEAPKDSLGNEIARVTSGKTGFVQANAKDADTFKNLANQGNGDNNRADWWFTAPYGGSGYYSDQEMLQPTYWTTLTVKNTTADLALCAGTQFDVSVEPSGPAFDTFLTPRNTKPFTASPKGGSL